MSGDDLEKRSFWTEASSITQARVNLQSRGHSLATKVLLDFQMDHARARDAVHLEWNAEPLIKEIEALKLKCLTLSSAARSREEYLKRPDLGRRLSEESQRKIAALKSTTDIAVVISNGLSSPALHRHGMAFIPLLLRAVKATGSSIDIYLVPNGRVALADEVGQRLKARLSLIIIGERPGLSAPDSLAVYLTYGPRVGNSDAQRNCISNIRPPEGLDYENAVSKVLYLIQESLRLQLSGVELKDESSSLKKI